ncbi:MAG: PKD domain-containing protein, partial [Myxococcales bacterium]|nr:PKD domain-containing protein [Myxococcales bacterium]
MTLSSLAALLWPGEAGAVGIWASDCNFGFQDVYNPGDAVCVTGELDVVPPGSICAEAYVVVTPAGSLDPFFDVSYGGANYVLGCAGAGAFFDEYVWLPNPALIPGQYDLVIDQWPFFGAFGAEDLRVTNAFTVSNAPLVYSVNVQAIKDAALEGIAYANSLYTLADLLTLIDTLSTAADWAGAFGPGGALAGLGLGLVCYTFDFDCPTSYNSAIITIGNKIIKGVGKSLEMHYEGIYNDPPDPMFEDVVPLRFDDALADGAPWAPGAGAALPTSQTVLAQLMSTQAAAYQALLPTVEKLQGAQAAGSHFGLLIQAEKTQAYAGLALEAGDAMLAEIDALQATLEAAGTYGVEVDVGGMLAQIEAGGLTTADRALIQSFGPSEADIDRAVAMAGAVPVPGPVSWQALLDSARGQFEVMRPALEDIIAQAEAIRAENEPYALRNAPVATVDAPAAGSVGDALPLSASATHLDPEAMLSYAWDLDGDGEFDDATGPDVEYTPVAPGLMTVAVEVDDGARRDIGLATIMVAVSNVPPEFTALVPEDYAPFADSGETVELSAEATDADGDPIAYTWYVDGAMAGQGATLAFEMPDELPHEVRVEAADDDPYSADARFTFHVRSSIWEDQVGDTDGMDTTGGDGADDTAGTSATNGNDDAATGSSGSAGADGEGGGGGGCG